MTKYYNFMIERNLFLRWIWQNQPISSLVLHCSCHHYVSIFSLFPFLSTIHSCPPLADALDVHVLQVALYHRYVQLSIYVSNAYAKLICR